MYISSKDLGVYSSRGCPRGQKSLGQLTNMVAGKRVPAAYRKGNRRSHLTGDAVYRTGVILVHVPVDATRRVTLSRHLVW